MTITHKGSPARTRYSATPVSLEAMVSFVLLSWSVRSRISSESSRGRGGGTARLCEVYKDGAMRVGGDITRMWNEALRAMNVEDRQHLTCAKQKF